MYELAFSYTDHTWKFFEKILKISMTDPIWNSYLNSLWSVVIEIYPDSFVINRQPNVITISSYIEYSSMDLSSNKISLTVTGISSKWHQLS